VNKYEPPVYATDISEGVFDFKVYGNTVFRPRSKPWLERPRDDQIMFNEEKHREELQSHIKIGKTVTAHTSDTITNLVIKYWDCFCEEGARRTIFDYEFAIDTGNAKPVCCRKQPYGPHEAVIIMKHIHDLLANDWIEECGGAWGSRIVLAAKPHQENIDDIKEFVWRMCVSYRKLNSVTKPFEFPIPRCDDAITVLEVGGDAIYIITVDARQGYHQVTVRRIDRDKLAFFAPNNKKYTWNVMPFGPTNAPGFYTCMMGNLRDEWQILFLQKLLLLKQIGHELITIRNTNEVFIGEKRIYSGTKIIIDDIFLWSTNLDLVILLFECVCQIFLKYRVSFRLGKCEFLKERVEYVGHDLTPTGNCPAASKFDMINDWKLPDHSQQLHSFVSLLNFYSKFEPYFEIKVKPLRRLYRQHFKKDIPLSAWTPELIELFNELKIAITSSPVLARFDPGKITFLKTDWSAYGMGYILMQPDDSEESIRATEILRTSGECLFDLTPDGPRLRPIRFGSRACTDREKYYHSFVGESACGRWGIGQNKRFLWGDHFYWMCDCKAAEEIVDYEGSISMICRWAQELLGYDFTVIHRKASMMIDVDGLSRRFGNRITRHVYSNAFIPARSFPFHHFMQLLATTILSWNQFMDWTFASSRIAMVMS